MQSTSSVIQSNAGQMTIRSGNCFNFFWMGTKLVDTSTAIDWLSHEASDSHRGIHHPSATGYGHAS
jgi:hypothetical protein